MRSMTSGVILLLLFCSSQHALGQRYGNVAPSASMMVNYNSVPGNSGAYCASCNAGVPAAYGYPVGMAQGSCCPPNPCYSECCDPCPPQRCCLGRCFDRLCELERRKNQWLCGGCKGISCYGNNCGGYCGDNCVNNCGNSCGNNCGNNCGGYYPGY